MNPRPATLGFIGLLFALGACSPRRDETASARPAADSATTSRAIFRSDEGKFANTDSILVRVDGDNRVRTLSFVYQAGTEYDVSVTQYQGLLGIPTSRTVTDSAGGKVDRAVWEDERTRFELTRFVAPGRPARVASTLLARSR